MTNGASIGSEFHDCPSELHVLNLDKQDEASFRPGPRLQVHNNNDFNGSESADPNFLKNGAHQQEAE